ncbi:Fur family transcriptional regulator [Actinocatenispora comari]|jgi:Fur family ferric uptake transcriptional regulator|uniref:Transcriptional repressor n=1 Tax=Actinocatenispora comari TaxID=2807577 RepID=A0A8J4EIY8_9ACTN|nr:transcriptional repressor [Actinocatenispora comari]GIL25373.1 transcriptional repressor [Actinocatenispora comari]
MGQAANVRTRRTAQKEAVHRILVDEPGFVSAQQLHQRMAAEGSPVGLATVYRQLNALAAAGQADTILVEGGQLYRACTTGAHHHHLVCDNCGKAVEIDAPPEKWIHGVAERHGYTITRHVLEVFGLCPECSTPNPD